MKEEPMALRLEPGPRHIAEAMVDFLEAYSWRVTAMVVNRLLPGYEKFVEEVRRVAEERSKGFNRKMKFTLEITQVIYYDGLKSVADVTNCYKRERRKVKNRRRRKWVSILKTECKNRYHNILMKLIQQDDRVFLFHGTRYAVLAEDPTSYAFTCSCNVAERTCGCCQQLPPRLISIICLALTMCGS